MNFPSYVKTAIKRLINDYSVKALKRDAERLNNCISSRHTPTEENAKDKFLNNRIKEIKHKATKDSKNIRYKPYNWKPMSFGAYESLVYAFGRSAREYGIISKIMHEISERKPGFKPKSYFDFGAGVGSGMWAASSIWKNSIIEYYNVDSSRYMNELSDLILRNGNECDKRILENVYYRQFFPSNNAKYDLVVCAFTMFELPSSKSRRDHILMLWNKCNGFMILVEEGSRKGFELINEARENILGYDGFEGVPHIFSPCPHSFVCPRANNDADITPCNFQAQYHQSCFTENPPGRSQIKYSFIVFEKNQSTTSEKSCSRIVRPVLCRHRHVICRVCTPEGELKEIIFSKAKSDRLAYRYARSRTCGDLIPFTIDD